MLWFTRRETYEHIDWAARDENFVSSALLTTKKLGGNNAVVTESCRHQISMRDDFPNLILAALFNCELLYNSSLLMAV